MTFKNKQDSNNKPVPVSEERIVYQGKIIEVVEQDMQIGSKKVVFEHARRSPGTRLLVVKDNCILLTKEYRREQKGYDYRLPGGKVFDTLEEYNHFLKTNNDLLKKAEGAAVREAREEVGIVPEKLRHYYTSKAGATIDWDLYYFIVEKFKHSKKGQALEDGEIIDVSWFEFDEAKEISLGGKMKEDRSVGVLTRFLDGHE